MASKIEITNSTSGTSEPAVKELSLEIKANEIMGIIGPSNSGKTSFLKTLNRLNELYPDDKDKRRSAAG